MSLKVSTKAINTTCAFKVLSTYEAFHNWLLPIIKLQCQIPQWICRLYFLSFWNYISHLYFRQTITYPLKFCSGIYLLHKLLLLPHNKERPSLCFLSIFYKPATTVITSFSISLPVYFSPKPKVHNSCSPSKSLRELYKNIGAWVNPQN